MAPICPGGSFSHNPAISHHISAWALKGTFKLQLSPGALLRPMEKGYLMLPILSPNPSPRWVTGSPFPALGVRTIQWVAVFLGLALLLCFEGALGLIQRSWGWCHLLQLANYLTLLPQSEEQGGPKLQAAWSLWEQVQKNTHFYSKASNRGRLTLSVKLLVKWA